MSELNKSYIDNINLYPGVPTSVIPYLEEQRKKNELYKKKNKELAQALVEFIGVKYEFGGYSFDGIDCSGLLGKSLKNMGYNITRYDVQTEFLACGNSDWLGINDRAFNSKTGDLGMINFYKTNGSNSINHMNYGIGFTNIPSTIKNPKKQLIDATEDSMENRNDGREGQYIKAGKHQVNQTYSPFSSETDVSVQGYIKWEVLENNYKE